MIPEMVDLFFYWINERHRIYIKYKVNDEPWPWTDDPILKKYKFTNVFRELDHGTIWLRENWREPYKRHERLFFNICLYRQFNWYKTAEFLGYTLGDTPGTGVRHTWDVEQVVDDLSYHKEQGNKIFTGAHMMTGTIKDEDGNKLPKIRQVVEYILDPLWRRFPLTEEEILKAGTLQGAYEILLEHMGFGPFLSYEVVTDLRHTRYLNMAPDIMSWANPGPGAMRGINRLRGWDAKPKKQQSQEAYIQDMQNLLTVALVTDRLESHMPQDDFEMRTIEHSLCEFDKWMRVKTGEGRPRQGFTPPHER